MKKGWDRYASEKRYVKKGYLRKYCNGSQKWEAYKTGSSDCLQQSRESQETIESAIETYGKCVILTEEVVPNEPFQEHEQLALDIYAKALKEVYGDEGIREKNVGQTYQEGRQGIQESNQRRCETEETNSCKTKGEKMKKQSMKEKKHEAKESKAFEKKEDKKESKSKKK